MGRERGNAQAQRTQGGHGTGNSATEKRGVTGQVNKRIARSKLVLQRKACLLVSKNQLAQEGVAVRVSRGEMERYKRGTTGRGRPQNEVGMKPLVSRLFGVVSQNQTSTAE